MEVTIEVTADDQHTFSSVVLTAELSSVCSLQ